MPLYVTAVTERVMESDSRLESTRKSWQERSWSDYGIGEWEVWW